MKPTRVATTGTLAEVGIHLLCAACSTLVLSIADLSGLLVLPFIRSHAASAGVLCLAMCFGACCSSLIVVRASPPLLDASILRFSACAALLGLVIGGLAWALLVNLGRPALALDGRAPQTVLGWMWMHVVQYPVVCLAFGLVNAYLVLPLAVGASFVLRRLLCVFNLTVSTLPSSRS
jgi:hypothetical protein